MNNLDNLYNFKNPIRHFFNLKNIKFDNLDSLGFGDLCWTVPVKFKVFKTEDSQRVISFPNILNFYHAIRLFEDEPNFRCIEKISSKKRVSPDLDIGEFSAFSYYDSIRRDIFNLTKYDKLLVLDIKSFYGRIYTHDLGFDSGSQKKLEQRVGSLNNGRTNGLLLGSYLSLYLAELVLAKIETKLDEEFSNQNIDCHFEYFSDDFYFFCNNTEIELITNVFSKVLSEYELEINYEKTTIYDFEEYSQNNNLEKLWRAIISKAQMTDRRYVNNAIRHTSIFTQLVYRLGQISELKYKRTFLANFFKTYYFFHLNPHVYILSESDFNYICYIYKLMPEAILYSINKIILMRGFDIAKFKEFVITRFKSSLHTEKQEEQVYFYYAFKVCGFDEELAGFKDQVLKSKNQILISYFILDSIIDKNDYQVFVSNPNENEWLQNYHYILKHDKTNTNLLIPENAKKEKQNLKRRFCLNKSVKRQLRPVKSF